MLLHTLLQEDDSVLEHVNGNFSALNMDKSKVHVHQIRKLNILQVHALICNACVMLLSRVACALV
jgi:hypothetical protein